MKDETVYMVSGYMRTGTSMMMKALEAGGLEAVQRPSRDKYKDQFSDEFYDPNQGGLYELESSDYKSLGFPRQFKGKLIKCLFGGIGNMAVVPHLKVVFMRRDWEEIRQSYQAFFNQTIQVEPTRLEERMQICIEQLQNRKDTDVEVFWYRDVLDSPHRYFSLLKERGWPIDVEKAIGVVDAGQCRFKLEELTVGII